ncbi:hypothetical protein [Arenibacter sp. F20364]|uniref:hypothetical protein n=1 Tax=Arenibacter sp. F20364 TaxID=2926415 RepID=UPI001FF441E5|nr:hypothetical protein [Arenibacter sp. F20364]MCK0190656.1 hypothetical protein [Arenibacter sp. F20364]
MSKKKLHGSKTIGKNKGKKKKFWLRHIKSNGQPTYLFDRALLSDHLENSGYRKLPNFGDIQVFQLVDNIAYLKSDLDVYNDILEVVKKEDDDNLRSCFIEQGETLLLSKKAILGGLPKINIEPYRDTKENICLFYENVAVSVAADGTKKLTYKDFQKLNKYILAEQIIDRKFKSSVDNKSDFQRFLGFVTNDKAHLESICSAIGYLISSYKNPSVAKAIIITDILSQVKNEAYGRSGKGLIIKALSKIINVVEYNGKVTDLTNDKFVFQNVNLNTSLIVLQDVNKGFQFESLFSTLTDNMSIERKHRSKISIPFKDSPKVALTTNYTIPQDTDSYKDRKHLVTLNNFFSASNKPEHYFKRLLFEWKPREWYRFDNFIVECAQLFLKKGLLPYDSAELKLQKLINLTSKEFVDLMESDYDVLNEYSSLKKIAACLEVGTQEPRSKGKIVGKWIESYAAYKGYKVDKRQSGGMVQICFLKGV